MDETEFGRSYLPIFAMLNYNHELLMHNDLMVPVILPETFEKILHQ